MDPDRQAGDSIDIPRYFPSFLIRFLGLFWVVSGASGAISNGLEAFWQYRIGVLENFDYFPAAPLAFFIGQAALTAIGLYMLFKHKKVLAFLTGRNRSEIQSSHRSEGSIVSEEWAACPQCGEEVLHDDTLCPICGAALDGEEGTSQES